MNQESEIATLTFEEFQKEVLKDYQLACESRETSLMGRKEVLTGKAKFGIFGDGKELPQIALSKFFRNGDWRSGYYRDQTLMMALGNLKIEEFFAQLYAHTSLEFEPSSAGRQMNGHFATRSLDEAGNMKDLMKIKNSSSDISPTAAQTIRGLGLAFASKLFRNNESLHDLDSLSHKGDEVCFVTIGDASTSEGYFWEVLNAAGVLQVPLVLSVWDDGYGISVPKKYQTSRGSISLATAGFVDELESKGIDVYVAKGWDYVGMIETYQMAVEKTRTTHKPALVHIEECTQPQGHSTSGSHERYKSKDRLDWEKKYDGLVKFKEWILENALSTEENLTLMETQAKDKVLQCKQRAWERYQSEIAQEREETLASLQNVLNESSKKEEIQKVINQLSNSLDHFQKNPVQAIREVMRITLHEKLQSKKELKNLLKNLLDRNVDRYSSHLYSEDSHSALAVEMIPAEFDDSSATLNGYEILNHVFDDILLTNKKVVAFGEDVGHIGDVNQGFMNMQEKHGKLRVFDTGIREATIMGQALGLALRGLRPIAEIQYLDYLIYGLQVLTDDVSTMRYRTKSGQSAPVIVRTRGHRLEGIWHTGSPMGMILNAIKGMYLCVPRNMTQAAGMYHTLLKGDDPALVIECLNGYRLKEKLPNNYKEFTVPLGKVEILKEGHDVTIVTYGSCCRIAQAASDILQKLNVSVEIIDVQTLIPFDIDQDILKSLKKTNRILFFDEDVAGGATAYMMQQVIEAQGGYQYLDAAPKTLSAKDNRSAYGTDGDYFCKPSVDDLVDKVYTLMHEAEPSYYPALY